MGKFRGQVQGEVQGEVQGRGSGSGSGSSSDQRQLFWANIDNSEMNEFDHEKLVVYRLALEFDALIDGLVRPRGSRAIRDQIDRASTSVVLCIAEGAGRRALKDKRRFYAMARGSATETAAALDILLARKLILQDGYLRGRALLLSIVRILTRLCGPTEPEPEPEPEPSP
jgi:four helix bundle protein